MHIIKKLNMFADLVKSKSGTAKGKPSLYTSDSNEKENNSESNQEQIYYKIISDSDLYDIMTIDTEDKEIIIPDFGEGIKNISFNDINGCFAFYMNNNLKRIKTTQRYPFEIVIRTSKLCLTFRSEDYPKNIAINQLLSIFKPATKFKPGKHTFKLTTSSNL